MNTLYDKLFIKIDEYYKYAISLNPKEYTDRKYSKGLDESLAVHMALAFAHLGLEIDDELFKLFWEKQTAARHQEFISFIERHTVSRDNTAKCQFGDSPITIKKSPAFNAGDFL